MFPDGLCSGNCKSAVNRKQSDGPFPRRGPDEGDLIGAGNIDPFNGGGNSVCTEPDLWIFERSGMKSGDRISSLIGWDDQFDPPTVIPGLEIAGERTAMNAFSESQGIC